MVVRLSTALRKANSKVRNLPGRGRSEGASRHAALGEQTGARESVYYVEHKQTLTVSALQCNAVYCYPLKRSVVSMPFLFILSIIEFSSSLYLQYTSGRWSSLSSLPIFFFLLFVVSGTPLLFLIALLLQGKSPTLLHRSAAPSLHRSSG